MADDTDLAAIRDWVAQGGKIGVDKEGNPVLPTGVLPAAGDDDEPTPAAPAAPTSAPNSVTTPGQTAAQRRQTQRDAERQQERQERAAREAQREQLKQQAARRKHA